MTQIEALYIFDEHNNLILEHVWTGRPPSAKTILPLYLEQPSPRPSLIYLTETNPPSLIFSILQDRLLFLSPSSTEIEPLLVLEFLHRVADALEDFLGSPLVPSKIESAYDVVAQLLGEMCDAGAVDKTEPNALRDVVEAPSRMGKFLEGVGLPGSGALAGTSTPSLSLQRKGPNDTPAIPWRRANVRHTSNELYVDMIESLSVILAPSGRPLRAMVSGSIAFTSKVSGVPELVLNLTCPGGRMAMESTLQLPVFHPCVRLARWRERPGELSFVPPDGRFVLAGYEVDLLGKDYLDRAFADPKYKPDLRLPATVEVRVGLGDAGSDFEVLLRLNNRFASGSSTSSSGMGSGLGGPGSGLGARSTSGTSNNPSVEDIVVTVPIPLSVRNLSELKASRGDATYSPGDGGVEWRIPSKALAGLGSGTATLRCTVVGPLNDEDGEANGTGGLDMRAETWDYDDAAPNQATRDEKSDMASQTSSAQIKRTRQNALLMPTSAAVSFTIKGWLASGIKVEKLNIDSQKSRGLGAGVQPYKGVKYLTVSRKGVEVRC